MIGPTPATLRPPLEEEPVAAGLLDRPGLLGRPSRTARRRSARRRRRRASSRSTQLGVPGAYAVALRHIAPLRSAAGRRPRARRPARGTSPAPRPGARPISIAPVIVARFITSGTLMPSSSAARREPVVGRGVEVRAGADDRDRQRLLDRAARPRARRAPTPARARTRSAAWPGTAGPRASGNSTGPSIPSPLITSTCSVTVPATSAVWPAISPSPCIACMSPR